MIFNLGSINADYFYRVPHLPMPGETLAASEYSTGLGGKGANQSVAIARANAEITHIGAVGRDGQWAVDKLKGFGVNTSHITTSDLPTAHAIINVDPSGENAIVIYSGANREQDSDVISTVLKMAEENDMLILQNETSHQQFAAKIAHAKGMRIVYSAAPFEMTAVQAMLSYIDILIMNEVEAAQLSKALGKPLSEVPVPNLLITKGAHGAEWHDLQTGRISHVESFKVRPVDTTGAGDNFAGYFIAGLSEGLLPEKAMRLAAAASAIQVTRLGTADAIPNRVEVEAFLANQ